MSLRALARGLAFSSRRARGRALDRPVEGLDALRGRLLAVVGPLAPALLRHRERRVVAYGLASIALALAFTFSAPMLLLAVGPVILGVPHLVADVRYLVARPGLHRRLEFFVLVLGPACASWIYPHAWVSMLALVGGAIAARAAALPRILVAIVACALVYGAVRVGPVADVALAHAHNAIAVGLFAVWSRRRGWASLVVVAFILGLAAIALGAFDGAPAMRLLAGRRLDPDALLATFAPGAGPKLACRGVLAFAFAQSVHYAVWLRLVPEEDRPRPGLRSFSSSLRALIADLGLPLAWLGVFVSLGFIAWGCASIVDARDGYLRIAIFHGPLELGAATLLLLENGSIRAKEATAS